MRSRREESQCARDCRCGIKYSATLPKLWPAAPHRHVARAGRHRRDPARCSCAGAPTSYRGWLVVHARVPRPLFPADIKDTLSWCRGYRGSVPYKARSKRHASARRGLRAAMGIRARNLAEFHEKANSAHHRRGLARKPCPRRHHHAREPEITPAGIVFRAKLTTTRPRNAVLSRDGSPLRTGIHVRDCAPVPTKFIPIQFRREVEYYGRLVGRQDCSAYRSGSERICWSMRSGNPLPKSSPNARPTEKRDAAKPRKASKRAPK